MSTKELAMETIRDLPEDATWQDIEEHIRFIAAIEKGLDDIKKGNVIPHEEVRKALSGWLSE